MRSSDLLAVRFPQHRLRDAYAMADVDAFVDRCHEALLSWERGVTPALRGDEVVHHEFRHTRFRPGYDPETVDDVLDRVVVALREYEQRSGS